MCCISIILLQLLINNSRRMLWVCNKILFSVAKIDLNESCTSADICADVMAVCSKGICTCMEGYSPSRGTCGM